MESLSDLKEIYYQKTGLIEEKVILEISESDNGPINNVIVGLEDEVFGISLVDETPPVRYLLFYINGLPKLQGQLIELTIDESERDGLLWLFAQELSSIYPHLDAIDVFNTFQRHTRTMLEKIGYRTYCPQEIPVQEGAKFTMIVPGVLGVFKVPSIDKLDFLRKFFGQRTIPNFTEKEDYVYLMLNLKSGLIKIGRSQKPRFREKTLQGEDPEIHALAFWKAPKSIETHLHKVYEEKRRRGEWFKLSLLDLKRIKEFMIQFD